MCLWGMKEMKRNFMIQSNNSEFYINVKPAEPSIVSFINQTAHFKDAHRRLFIL